MNIIYTITILLIIGLHMLIYKKEEQQNIIKYLGLTISLLLCYNIVICVILSFLKIKCTLTTLSIINVLFSIPFGVKIYKDKKIQKYYINKMDIIAITVLTLMVISIAIVQYGIKLEIKHETTDASTHYFASNEFYNYSILLMEENSEKIEFLGQDFLMPGAYINTGILLKIFSKLVDEIYFCKLYIIFDISMWLLSGILMYILLSNSKKEEKNKVLSLIFSIIYMLAYPLNSLLYGFSYLQLGLNIIISILIVMKFDSKSYYKYILISIFCFALMFSYYYFAPVVFLAIFIQILWEIKERREQIFIAKNILNILISLIIPGLFGVMYFIVFQYFRFDSNPIEAYSNGINTPGPIYQNLISTTIIFIVLSIYYIIESIKNKKNNIVTKMLILGTIFTIVVFIGMRIKIVSEYYYYKLYYMLWIYFTVGAYYSINILKDKFKLLTYSTIILYCIGIMIAIIFNKNIIFFDIYEKNFSNVINEESKIISNDELKIFKYYNNEIDTIDNMDNTTYLYTNMIGRQKWFYALTKNTYIYINTMFVDEIFTDIQQFFDSDKINCIIFKFDNPDIYENIENVENIDIIYKNEAGVIIKKNYTE